MRKKIPEVIYDGEDVERCRQVRRNLEKRFKTVDEFFDYCERVVQRRGSQTAKPRKKATQLANRSRRNASSAAKR
jgi:hypothetical protein